MDIIAIYIIFSKITMKTVLTSRFFFFILGGDSTSCGANVGYEEMEYVWSLVVLVRILNYRSLEGFARRIRTFKHRCPSSRLDESKRLFPELKFMKASCIV